MRRRDIGISIAIIAAAPLLLYTYRQGRGRIEIDAGGAMAELQLRSDWFGGTTVASARRQVSASAGVYRPKRLSISMEQDGYVWRIDSGGPWENLSKIRVKNLRTTALRLGPPLSVRPKVRRRGSSVEVDFTIVGQAGEHYEKFVTRANQAIRNAEVRIVDETAKTFRTGRFAYG